jgi:type IV secretion system protein VirB1
MTPEVLLSLVLTCAPQVHPQTASRLIQVESASNPFAIGINGPYRLNRQPRNKDEAIATAKMLIAAGHNIDLGLAMINAKNLRLLGLDVEAAFDPCSNLRAMQSILSQAYTRAAQRRGHGQAALIEALSEYNTGQAAKGLQNGYVARVFAARPATEALLAQSLPNQFNGGR